MLKVLRILGRLLDPALALSILLAVSPALAQSIQLAPGEVIGNDTSAQRPGRATTLSKLSCPAADPQGIIVANTALAACLAANKFFLPQDGTYRLNGELVLHDGQVIGDNPNAIFHQYTRGARVFYGANLTGVSIGNVVTYGEGTFCGNPGQIITAACPNNGSGSGVWLGDGGINGHNDRGVQLDNCTNCRVAVHAKNHGTAGIAIFGGKNITLDRVFVEGTNLYSTAIASQGNFQYGLMLFDDSSFGAIDGLVLNSPVITGTAQGTLSANGGTSTVNKSRIVNGGIVYGITGQHAWYGSTGNYVLNGFACTNIRNSCVKNQIANAGYDPYNFTATGVSGDTVGGNLFEATVIGGTGLHVLKLQGVCNGCGRGLSTLGPLSNLTASLNLQDTTGEAVYVSGVGPKDFDIYVDSTRSGVDGILVDATNADQIRFHRPIIRNPSTAGAGRYAALINSASANVTFTDPVFVDGGGLMLNGLNNLIPGSAVKVFGSAAITGATGACVSATAGATIPAWPINLTLSCGSNYSGASNISNVDIGSGTVPFGSLFLKTAGAVNWANGGLAITESGDAMVFGGASNGYQFDGAVLPTTNRTADLGISTRGFFHLYLDGSTSGTMKFSAPAIAGTAAIDFGTSSGTPAVTASSPLVITAATGNIACATCVTSSGGGAITGTAPIAVSAAGAVSINAPYTTLTASNGGIVYSGAANLAILAGTATARQMLQSGASTTPAWSTTTWPATTTINRLLWSSAANVISDLATANSSILVTDGGGIPSLSTTLPAHTLAGNITGAGFGLTSSTSTNASFSPVFARNTSNGNAAQTIYQLQNDTAGSAIFGVTSSTFTTAIFQNRLYIQAASTNAGILLDSGGASSPIVFGINSTEQARVQASGGLSVGTTTDPGAGGIIANVKLISPTHSAAGALAFQTNGTTAAGSISTGQQWVLGNATTAPSGPVLTLTKNSGTLPVVGSFSPMNQVAQADDTQTLTVWQSFSSDGLKQPNLIYAKARGTAASPTAVQSGDFIGANFGYGYATSGASGYVTGAGAGFLIVAAENYTSTAAGASFDIYATATGSASVGMKARVNGSGGFSVNTSSDPGAGMIYTNSSTFMIRTKTSYANGAGVGAGTITTAPSAGNPTKWIPIDDNGTTRYVPAW